MNRLHYIFAAGLCSLSLSVKSQFAAAAGQPGSTAMHKDSSAFIDWAVSGKVVRGFQNVANTSSGYANVGDSSMAFGIAGSNGVVSLGDGGYAILQFNSPVIDLPGPDLAVFENSFSDTFLELAFVEVSSDGTNYFRFPATSNTDTTTQTGSFGYTNPTQIDNLAGKYRANYGTPFSLEDIPNHALLNKQAITHVKIVDVVGTIQNAYCSRDQYNHKVNDPWPTEFGSGGFDLDAVGVIHNQNSVGVRELFSLGAKIYPNPAKETLNVMVNERESYSLKISSLLGQELYFMQQQQGIATIPLNDFKEGVYFVTVTSKGKSQTVRLVKL